MNALAPALLTDLYQLTMAQGYFELDMRETISGDDLGGSQGPVRGLAARR